MSTRELVAAYLASGGRVKTARERSDRIDFTAYRQGIRKLAEPLEPWEYDTESVVEFGRETIFRARLETTRD